MAVHADGHAYYVSPHLRAGLSDHTFTIGHALGILPNSHEFKTILGEHDGSAEELNAALAQPIPMVLYLMLARRRG